jgi:hypothetical protein
LLRHSVDFGFRVTVVTQVIACQVLIAQICSESGVSAALKPGSTLHLGLANAEAVEQAAQERLTNAAWRSPYCYA